MLKIAYNVRKAGELSPLAAFLTTTNRTRMADTQHSTLSERKQAMLAGLPFYSTGKPCKHGHIAKRFTYNAQCTECSRIAAGAYYKNNAGKILTKKYIHDKDRSKKIRQTKRYKETHNANRRKPEYKIKERAHTIVCKAVKNGILKRLPCEKCGKQKSEAHHDDYSKPLEVIWFCHTCHMEHHRNLNYALRLLNRSNLTEA